MGLYDMQINDNSLLSETDRALLTLLAKQTGTDLAQLTEKYLKGDLNSLVSLLPSDRQTAAKKIIADPKAMEKMRRSVTPETVREIIRKSKEK